jgi:hypothetical protein
MTEDEALPTPQVGDLLKPLREIAARMTEITTAAATAGARAAPDFVALPLAEFTDGMLRLSELTTGPLRRVMEEQRELAQLMAEWAQKHMELSAQIAGWAEEHRKMTEQMHGLLAPVLEQADSWTSATKTVAEELRH